MRRACALSFRQHLAAAFVLRRADRDVGVVVDAVRATYGSRPADRLASATRTIRKAAEQMARLLAQTTPVGTTHVDGIALTDVRGWAEARLPPADADPGETLTELGATLLPPVLTEAAATPFLGPGEASPLDLAAGARPGGPPAVWHVRARPAGRDRPAAGPRTAGVHAMAADEPVRATEHPAYDQVFVTRDADGQQTLKALRDMTQLEVGAALAIASRRIAEAGAVGDPLAVATSWQTLRTLHQLVASALPPHAQAADMHELLRRHWQPAPVAVTVPISGALHRRIADAASSAGLTEPALIARLIDANLPEEPSP